MHFVPRNHMNIILFGPQGSGKGTQARLLCDKFGFFYFESGAYLRRIAQEHSDIKKMLAEGLFVPDKEMTSYLTAFLDQENIYDGILFDGFPRTLDQYTFLKEWLTAKQVKIDLGIVLNISEDETVRRLSARRLDPKSGKIYNLVTDLPPSDVDVNSLVQREDDKPEAIKKRLELYNQMTKPLISQMQKDTNVVEVNGEQSIEDIQKELVKIIESLEQK